MNPAAMLLSVIPEGDSVGDILSGAGLTILIGLVVVFAALIVLVLIFWLFGKIVHRGAKPEETPPAPVVPAAPVMPASATGDASGVSDEVVAVIAAAVAAMAPAGKRYAVRRVQPAGHGRSAWAAAGIAENTQPF